MTARENFIRSLENLPDGLGSIYNIRGVGSAFADLLKSGDLSFHDGSWHLVVRPLGSLESAALLVESYDQNQFCSALVTHDLSSFACKDVTKVLDKIRIGRGIWDYFKEAV